MLTGQLASQERRDVALLFCNACQMARSCTSRFCTVWYFALKARIRSWYFKTRWIRTR